MSVFTLVVKGEGPGNSIASGFIALNPDLRGIFGYLVLNYFKMAIFFSLWSESSVCLM